MNEKQTERLLNAVESIAKSLASIDLGVKSMAGIRRAKLSPQERIYEIVENAPGIEEPTPRKEAAAILGVHPKTLSSHADELGLPSELNAFDLDKIRRSIKAKKLRPHLKPRKGGKYANPVGRKKVS